MKLSNEIVLRPRFVKNLDIKAEKILDRFEADSDINTHLKISRVDDHVFIRIPKKEQHFWSPQLHLEINEDYDQKSLSTIYGLFGPNPTVWTMFMFFHFVVAGFFIGFAIWAYVNWSLDNSYAVQLFVTMFMIVIWFALYLSGRMGKRAGLDQMHELHHFMRDTLRSQNLHSVN